MMSHVLPVVTIIAAIGVFFGYVNPTYTGPIAGLQQEIKGYESALKAADEFRERQKELLADRSAILEEDIDRVEAFLPDNVNNVQLILDLNALAARTGIILSNFDVDIEGVGDSSTNIHAESSSPVESVIVTLSASGTYQAFRTFLDAAEHSLRPLDLVSLSVSDSETGVYTYSMKFRMYWLR